MPNLRDMLLRLLKKEKLKQQLKEFEELQKTNPEEALKKLEELEKARALERHTLRHKNTGKWAKNKAVRAKYDKEARQQLAEQLAVSRGLTQKTQEHSSDEEEESASIPDFTLSQDPFNPWMVQRSGKSTVDLEYDFGYKKHLKDKMFKKQESDSDTDENDETERLSTTSSVKSITKDETSYNKGVKRKSVEDIQECNMNSGQNDTSLSIVKSLKKSKANHNPIPKVVSTASWIVDSVQKSEVVHPVLNTADVLNAFDKLDDNVQDKVKRTLSSLTNSLEESDTSRKSKKIKSNAKYQDNLKNLEFKNNKLKCIIDEQLNESSSYKVETLKENDLQTKVLTSESNERSRTQSDSNIDPSRFIQVKPTYLNTILSQAENDLDQLDEDEQVVPKVNIEEVFEDDDVVASFRQEKEEEANKDNPVDIELNMPGWGSWGGKGIRVPKKKSSRLILKEPSKIFRKDENKGDIIIKEYRDPKLSAHKVIDVPHPFESVKEYEAIIRTPLGNTFIPEKAHQKLIKPSIITKIGSIISPMDENELLVPRNMNYKNKSVIKVLAKK
ncbi:U3 small nucleolar RNA-associated protein 14 homolog A [Eumeta japonica]|uniref:U3 small nucleolar RNA-associated protein 14 homolog A n=1 Tax=Eumeta variegata TaxID=151549 RepID=A0A4C1UUF9_EUMVA|nr:U3 small nucleolar RNA-associated protein 14 homolog A [Eumeta japonica]